MYVRVKLYISILFIIGMTVSIHPIHGQCETEKKSDVSEWLLNSPPDRVTEFASDLFSALGYMHMAWPETVSVSNDAPVIDLMRILMDSNKKLARAEMTVNKYAADKSEPIRISTQFVHIGCRDVRNANLKFLEVLRNLDTLVNSKNPAGNLHFATAEYISERKEAFLNTIQGASAFMVLMWEPAKTSTPTGKIPWRISREQRQRLLQEIDNLFGAEIKKYHSDPKTHALPIPFLMSHLQMQLTPETYEEGAILEKKERGE